MLRAADRVIRLDALSPEQLRDLDQLYHSTRDVRVATARLNGLDPEAYLRRVLGHIADHPIYRVAELLPRNLAGKHPSAAT